MSSQQIKNIVNTQIDSFITQAQQEIRNEALKELEKQKKNLPTPQEIMSELGVDINQNTCSDRGKDKFYKRFQKKYDKLNNINNKIKDSSEKLGQIEFKLTEIMNGGGPFFAIRSLEILLKDVLIPLLVIIIALAPALLSVLTGPAANVKVGDMITERRKKAKSKTKEYQAIISSISHLINYYLKKITPILIGLRTIKTGLSFISNEIDKILLFMYSHVLRFEEQCAIETETNDSTTTTTAEEGTEIIEDPSGSTPLSEYLQFLESQYNDVYQTLQTTGNEKAIKRVFKLKENLEEDYNISFKVINL